MLRKKFGFKNTNSNIKYVIHSQLHKLKIGLEIVDLWDENIELIRIKDTIRISDRVATFSFTDWRIHKKNEKNIYFKDKMLNITDIKKQVSSPVGRPLTFV